jgi:hypothetical protein
MDCSTAFLFLLAGSVFVLPTVITVLVIRYRRVIRHKDRVNFRLLREKALLESELSDARKEMRTFEKTRGRHAGLPLRDMG